MAFQSDPATARFMLPMRGAPNGSYDIIHQWVLNRPTVYESQLALAAGNNTVNAGSPLSATSLALIIIPPANTTDTWVLKGNAGDTGVTIAVANQSAVVLAGFVYSIFVINATTGSYQITLRWVS